MATIKGTIKKQLDKTPVPGVTVELFLRLQNKIIKNLKANVDAQGRFAIAFDANSIPALAQSKDITLLAQVWRNGTESIPVVNNPLITNLELKDYDLDVLVNLPAVVTPPATPGRFSVEGRVTDASGVAAARLTVTVFDRDMRREEVLGSATTDADGRYQISYSSVQFTRAEKERADLVVRVIGPDGKTELTKSETLFNAPANAEVNLTISADKLHLDSEWERYHRELALIIENIPIQDLTDEDLNFLHGETGIELMHLQWLRHAYRWSVEHRQHQLPTETFYGFLRQGLSPDWPQFLQAGPSRWRAALKQAVAAMQVPQSVSTSSDVVVQKLQELAVDLTFSADTATSSTFTRPVGLLLSGTTLTPQLQRRIAGLLLERKPGEDPQQWWKTLADAGVPAQAVNATRFALEADALLGGHLPTLKTLQADLAKSFGTAQELALLTRQQWQQVARKAAEDGGLPKEFETGDAYAETMAKQVESAFPTQAVMYRLREAAQPVRRDVGLFLSLNPQFDLLNSSIENSLAKANFRGIQTPKAELAAQLRKEVAVARIVPHTRRAEHMALLLDKGYGSASKVVLKGKVAFTRDIVSVAGAKTTDAIYRKAKARAHAAVVTATGILNYFGPFIPVLPHLEPTGHLATWIELFGSGNGCHCPACASAHGPAAYLVALLEFLKEVDAKAPKGGASLTDVLRKRRPDLWHLKLNCANAETPLPYIDLVIEHLEQLVASLPEPRLDYTAGSTPQTAGDVTAAQLRAEPGHRLDSVYAPEGRLQRETFPWQLPFDRNFERARIDFELLGISAAEVLEVVGTDEITLALTRSGLNRATWDLLHDAVATSADDVLEAWGARNWVEDLLKIGGSNGLLKRSGLEVSELYTLLESESEPWAGWRVIVDRGDDPCDVDRHVVAQRGTSGSGVVSLDSTIQTKVFDLLHRALRLRLRMGWSTATLLAAMQALGVDAEHPAFDMVAVARLVALAKRLGVTPEQLAKRMVALRENSGDPGSAASRAARGQWLSLIQLSDSEHADLTALGLPDLLADVAGAERLRRLEQMMHDRDVIVESRIDPAELRYLLQDVDFSPPVFASPVVDIDRYLGQIVSAIREAGKTDMADTPDEAALLVRRTIAAIQSLLEVTGHAFVAQVVSDQGTVRALLQANDGAGAPAAVHAFLSFAAATLSSLELDDQAKAILLRIIKTCRLLDLLRFTAEDLTVLAQIPRDGVRWLDFNMLPVQSGDAPLTFDRIRGLLLTSLVQVSIKAREPRLLTIMHSASTESAGAVDALTAWGRVIADPGMTGSNALNTVVRALRPIPAEAEIWRDPQTYVRLMRAAQWLQRRRLPASDLLVLRDAAEAGLGMDALAALTRCRFDTDEAYFSALTPSMDRLRIRQRDALLSYLLQMNTQGWKTADDIYEHLLIDVQMGPCQLTSRIVQAHSAVQLFVQRCLQNLEVDAGVLLGDVSDIGKWREWSWLKNFRVCEAARKVFLYPENWIEPDLRIGKSPFFEALENELLQDEITGDNVERALRNYLVQLHEVSNLDVRALYEETYDERLADGNTVSRRVIHMVGRTRGRPHVYYYRARHDDLSWTPWEKIDLSIDADHLVLAVHNRRPTLFWPQWQEVQIDRNDPPTKAWDMSLNLSTLEFGRWSAPVVSNGAARLAHGLKDVIALRPRFLGETVEVLLYERFQPVDTREPSTSYGYQFARSAFRVNSCTGEIEHVTLPERLPRFIPYGVVPRQQRLVEEHRDNRDGVHLISGLRSTFDPEFPVDRVLKERVDAVLEKPLGICLFLIGLIALAAHEQNRLRELMASKSETLLNGKIDGYVLVPSQQYPQMSDDQPYVFQYDGRQLLAIRKTNSFFFRLLIKDATIWFAPQRYVLELGDHPFMCDLLEAVRSEGVDGLYRQAEWAPVVVVPSRGLRRHPRQRTVGTDNWVRHTLIPNVQLVAEPYPVAEFDFSSGGAYSLYNWELFFHVPLMLAEQLRKNQRYEEAQRWFHTIFDPMDVSPYPPPQKYWRVKPLFTDAEKWGGTAESMETLLDRLWAGHADVVQQVEQWRKDPFDPHALASLRLVAYMKTVVQKYVENVIDWGDSLFRRDTMESINEATQLYALASRILGEQPVELPAHSPDAKSYAELSGPASVDTFGNALIDIETGMPFLHGEGASSGEPLPGPSMLYFCIPSNPRLRELRSAIDDRLFKIRHCMDIDGRLRQLALFAPPIDPALLVRARAAGLDIGTALSMAFDVRRSPYRFQPLLQKALEFTNEVRSFGGALLSALEKRDSEELAQMRVRHEVGLLKLVSEVKRRQSEEADANLDVVRKSRAIAKARLDFYEANLVLGRSPAENAQVSHLHQAHGFEITSSALNTSASIFHALPTSVIGFPCNGIEWGGPNIGHAMQAAASALGLIAQQWAFEASMSGYNATYDRRSDEWRFQVESATREIAQIDQQIIAAEIRLAIAKQEQHNHARQIAQAEETESMLRDKFTNVQLYNWMAGQLSAMHYHAYRMAFDLAKQAESSAHLEVDTPNTIIGMDHWDAGRKGLLAGERLAQDLRRLEVTYMKRNTRQLEITSNISLRRLDPNALWKLRLDGTCTFTVPTWLFDMDFPDHQRRRIKSVSVSVPGVVGPYGGVNGILQCKQGSDIRTIATSSGQNDAGVFQLDFRDERYLPFEGISLDSDPSDGTRRTEWSFSLPAENRPFDYETISDVVLHIHYTARPPATSTAPLPPPPSSESGRSFKLLVSVRHDFPAESRQLREHGAESVTVILDDRLFPYFARNPAITKIIRLPARGDGTASTEVPITMVNSKPGLALGATDADSYFVVEYGLQIQI